MTGNKKYHYVYRTVNKLNGMEYIGVHSTNDMDDGYIGSGTYFCNALKKHGKHNFEKQIIELFTTRAEALKKEREIVNYDFIADNRVYNLVLGGEGVLNRSISIHKFGIKDKYNIEYKTPDYRKDIDGVLLDFYVLAEDIEVHKDILIARLHEAQDIHEKTLIQFTLSFVDRIDPICAMLTNYWNDKRFHLYTKNALELIAKLGLFNYDNRSLIKYAELV
jgi:hypothetical protein